MRMCEAARKVVPFSSRSYGFLSNMSEACGSYLVTLDRAVFAKEVSRGVTGKECRFFCATE